jgi:type I restriction enzyme S subunit
MEVKPGYKQSDAGVIPEDWSVKQVRDLKPFVTSGSRGWAGYYSDRGSPFIRITNLSRETIYLDLGDLRFVNLKTSDSEASRTQLQDGDVLISITADIGIIGYISSTLPKPAYINQHIALLRFNPKQTSPKFVSYFLASEKPQTLFRALTDSGAKAGMNLTTVQQIRLALPPTKAEQEAIAEALSDADALVASLEQLIVKKRRLKQGAMHELLTGKKRLPQFEIKPIYKQTETGAIPEDWTVAALTSIADVRDGTHDSPPYTESGIPFVTSKNIVAGTIEFEGISFISQEDAKKIDKRSKVDRGDILLSMIGTVGNAAIVDFEPRFCIKNVALIKPKTLRVEPQFLIQLFRSDQYARYIDNKLDGGIQKFISLGMLRSLDIALPSTKAEQAAIAAILFDMDTEVARLETKLAKARHLKKGMMQELLTGKTRLV